jgi:hypothetical protein
VHSLYRGTRGVDEGIAAMANPLAALGKALRGDNARQPCATLFEAIEHDDPTTTNEFIARGTDVNAKDKVPPEDTTRVARHMMSQSRTISYHALRCWRPRMSVEKRQNRNRLESTWIRHLDPFRVPRCMYMPEHRRVKM